MKRSKQYHRLVWYVAQRALWHGASDVQVSNWASLYGVSAGDVLAAVQANPKGKVKYAE